MGLRLYAAAAGALSPFAGALLKRRVRSGKEDPERLGERLGFPSLDRPVGRLAWLHGASVGESLSLTPLARRLKEERGAEVLVTSGTRAAAEILAQRLPAGVMHQYAPIDTPAAARRFVGHWRPELAVFVESDLWPNLIAATKARGARLALVSARLSPASVRRWALAPSAARVLFGSFDLILARDQTAAAALRSLGAEVDGVADAKLAAPDLPVDSGEAERLGLALGGRPVIVAASTHPGEEALILAAFAATARRLDPRPLLVIVPRHARRGAAVEDLAQIEGLAVARRTSADSVGRDLRDLDVYVSDTVGELGLWYRLADLVVLGGSFVEGVGGHNPLEPARLGRAIVVGPWTENWPICRDLAGVGGCECLPATSALVPWLDAVVEDHPRLLCMGRRAQALAMRRDAEALGALDRVLGLIGP